MKSQTIAVLSNDDAFTVPIPANDNHKAEGAHEWPAYNRLKAGKLMPSAGENAVAMVALCRLRHDLVAMEGQGAESSYRSDNSMIDEDVAKFNPPMRVERVTAEHLIALHTLDELEYRKAPDGQVLPFKKDGEKFYQLEDRYRGEPGAAKAQHEAEIDDELNGRYHGAHWPSAPGAATLARELFVGAQMKAKGPPRIAHSPETAILKSIYARKTVAFIKGGMTRNLWNVLELTVTGSTSEYIGEQRGRSGKYATAVGTELQRFALESLVEIYAEYDGCHQEVA